MGPTIFFCRIIHDLDVMVFWQPFITWMNGASDPNHSGYGLVALQHGD